MKRRISASYFLGHEPESPWPTILGLLAVAALAVTCALVGCGLVTGVGL